MFPTTPTVNQTYNGYKWNGELWEVYHEPESGSTLQMEEVQYTGTMTIGPTPSWVTIGTLTTSFTPKYSNSKILVQYKIEVGEGTSISKNGGHFAVFVDGVAKNVPPQSGLRTSAHSGVDGEILSMHNTTPSFGQVSFISETTNSITIEIKGLMRTDITDENILINKSSNDGDGSYSGRYVSNMVIWEIKQ